MSTTNFDAEQESNAQTIISVGRALHASDSDIQVALMTALQESGLHNVDYGDRDSLGLFQQRAAWGAAADRMNPAKSAYMFFTGGQGGQRGLLDFQNRGTLSPTQQAQAVQVSAFPDAYAKWAGAAQALLGANPAATTTTETAAAATAAPTQAGAQSQAVGAGQVAAQGAGAVTSPGAAGVQGAGVEGPLAPLTQPADTGTTPLSYEQFNALFPDAAATKMFSGASSQIADARRSDLISTAMSYLGTPYVWGGTSKQSGVDCSGLVQDVYKSFGIDLPRISSDQIRAGNAVSFNQLQPGDLIGWDENSRNNGADHIAIYAGNNQIIEAPRPGLAVRIRTLDPEEIKTALGAHFDQL